MQYSRISYSYQASLRVPFASGINDTAKQAARARCVFDASPVRYTVGKVVEIDKDISTNLASAYICKILVRHCVCEI